MGALIAIIVTSMRTNIDRRLVVTGLAVLGLAVASILQSSINPASAASANISHSYQVKTSVPSGGIVSLDPTSRDFVEPASTDNASRLLGVVVADNDSLLAFEENNGNIQVATSGSATALVSDLNGDIKIGDQIGVSPFNGIGMKVVPGGRSVGIAQTEFNSSSKQSATREVTDKLGKSRSIKLGYVRVNVSVTSDANQTSTEKRNTLQKLGHSLTGKTISTPRIIISAIIAILTIVALVTLIHAAIYGSLISVGRNPLAKHAVFKALTFVILMAFATLLMAGGTIALLLR